MAIAEVSIVPIGTGDTSVSKYVARVYEVLQRSGLISLKYELTAMGTIISGDIGEIWQVLREMHESCFEEGVHRVLTSVKIDDRRDRVTSPEHKVKSVIERLPESSKSGKNS
jgi:uncharacterized protein (TIGR00106 family)